MKTNATSYEEILTVLGIALFYRDEEGTIWLNGPEPQWLGKAFREMWNPAKQTLTAPEFSALDSFLQSEPTAESSMIFEDKMSDGVTTRGVITACGNGLFALRQSASLEGHNAASIQKIREKSLAETAFGESKRRKNALPEMTGNPLAEVILPLAISTVSEALIILSPEGELVVANEAAHGLFPDLSRTGNTTLWDSMTATAISKEQLGKTIENVRHGFDEPLETTLELPLPLRQTWNTRVLPVHTTDGAFGGSIWSFRKKAAATDFLGQISEAERLEAVGRLAGGVAHDFNNLLAIVLGNLTLLADAAVESGNADIQESAELAAEAAEKAAGMVRQLLGYSRKSQLHRSVMELDRVIESTAKLFNSTAGTGVELELDLQTNDWKISADSEKLGQVFLNVFENAAQAMKGFGDITVTARTFILDDLEMARAMNCEQGHYFVINITDNGPGMPEEIREKVFEPFFTTKEVGKGTGLGLANALGIIQQHGGHISCTSIPGEGTAFTIYLPRDREAISRRAIHQDAVTNERRLDKAASKSREPAILVVDDEELLRNVVRTMLQKHGFRTMGAVNGREALDIICQHRSEISAIVLDLAMPEMTGNELFKKLNQLGIDIPVIVASGYLVDTDKFVRETGGPPAAFFSKPYQLGDLLTKVRDNLPTNQTAEDGAVILAG